jgi:hypothetical protein
VSLPVAIDKIKNSVASQLYCYTATGIYGESENAFAV